jgi:L-amino acid N-acyltransferase YncA
VIRPATAADAAAIARIYDHYVRHTAVTFEEESVPTAEMAARIDRVLAAGLPYLVLEQGDRVVGYSYAGGWHARSAYRFAVETTIYLEAATVGAGLGTRLYGALLERLSPLGLHTAIGVITIPNPASVALHEKLGFRPSGRLQEVGFKQGRWIDVGYWQRPL